MAACAPEIARVHDPTLEGFVPTEAAIRRRAQRLKRRDGLDTDQGEGAPLDPVEGDDPTSRPRAPHDLMTVLPEEDETPERGFLAVKPWLGAIWPPTVYCKDPKEHPRDHIFDENNNNWGRPNLKVDLDFVFGFSGNRYLSSVWVLDADTVLYMAAALVIVHHIEIDDQDFYFGHDDDVLCLAVHEPKRLVASGSLGERTSCRLCIWEAETQKTIHTISGFHQFGILSVGFNPSGTHVVSVGWDEHHSVAVHSVETGLMLATCPADKNRLIGVSYASCTSVDAESCFVTWGVRHICFWKPVEQAMKSSTFYETTELPMDQRLLWCRGTQCEVIDEATFYCCAFSPKMAIFGAHNGKVYGFDANSYQKKVEFNFFGLTRTVDTPRPGAEAPKATGRDAAKLNRNVLALNTVSDDNTTLVVGLHEGTMHFFDVDGYDIALSRKVRLADGSRSINTDLLDESTNNESDVLVGSVRALDYNPKTKQIVIGTALNFVYVLDVAKSTSEKLSFHTVVGGHWGNLSSATQYGEVWGVDCHPTEQWCYSCSYDGTVRLWNLVDNAEIKRFEVGGSAVSVAVNLDGTLVAVGRIDGSFVLVDGMLSQIMVPRIRDRRRRVRCMRFSPDGRYLAVAAELAIDIYEIVKSFKPQLTAGQSGVGEKLKFKPTGKVAAAAPAVGVTYEAKFMGSCVAHTAMVSKLDWNIASNVIQTTSMAYELIYFSVPDCRAVTGTRQLRDQHWFTQSCTFGWGVQGIWPRFSDGTDINTAARSHSQKFVATTDDWGQVSLFNYPCVGSGMDRFGRIQHRPQSITLQGHASHVTNAAWSPNDKYLVTTGGYDLCLFVWKVENLDGPVPEDAFIDAKFVQTKREEYAAKMKARKGTGVEEAPKAFIYYGRDAPLVSGIVRERVPEYLKVPLTDSGLPAKCVMCDWQYTVEAADHCPRCLAPRVVTVGPMAGRFKAVTKAPTRTGKKPNLGGVGIDEIEEAQSRSAKLKASRSTSAGSPSKSAMGASMLNVSTLSSGTAGGSGARFSVPTMSFAQTCRVSATQRESIFELRKTASATWMPSGMFDPRTTRLPVPEDDSDSDEGLLREKVLKATRPASAPAIAKASVGQGSRRRKSPPLARSAKLFQDMRKKKQDDQPKGPKCFGPDFSDY